LAWWAKVAAAYDDLGLWVNWLDLDLCAASPKHKKYQKCRAYKFAHNLHPDRIVVRCTEYACAFLFSLFSSNKPLNRESERMARSCQGRETGLAWPLMADARLAKPGLGWPV